MKISACIPCCNRLWQLEQTLNHNLEVMKRHEVCLVNFGSTDGMDEWVNTRFSRDIAECRLRYFSVSSATRWHIAKAKNLAHRIATGEFLINLDADNFMDPDDLNYFMAIANEKDGLAHQFSGKWGDGSCGRIGLPRSVFYMLGGYDEALLPYGFEDLDLLFRARASGVRVVKINPPGRTAIQNSEAQRVAFARSDPGEEIVKINRLNEKISNWKLNTYGSRILGGFATFEGVLNGSEQIRIDGLGNVQRL